MALPVWLTWSAAKGAAKAAVPFLKLAAVGLLIWYVVGAFKHWVDAQKLEREEYRALVRSEESAKYELATQQAATEALRQTIAAQEQALAEAQAAAAAVNAQFAAYRRGEAARNQRFVNGRFRELLQAKPVESEAEVNAAQKELYEAYREVFDAGP